MRKWFIALLLVSILVLLAFLFLTNRLEANDMRSSYRDIAIGDPESKLMNLVDTQDYLQIGVAEQTPEGPTWTQEWVQGGPIKSLLTAGDLKKNRFWDNLGWTYPIHPLTDRVIVIAEVGGWRHGFIYVYMDDSEKVVAIYVGGT